MNQEFVLLNNIQETDPDFYNPEPRHRPQTGINQQKQRLNTNTNQTYSRPLSSNTLHLRNMNVPNQNRNKNNQLQLNNNKNYSNQCNTINQYSISNHNNNFSNSQKQLITKQPGNKLLKIKPKKIAKEKEKLYEEQIVLKQQLNAQLEDNLLLRTRNKNLENENNKYLKVIENMQRNQKNKNSQNNNYSQNLEKNNNVNNINNDNENENNNDMMLLQQQNIRLRKQIRELRDSGEQKDKNYEELKKSQRVTQVQELQVELVQYQEESYRLRKMLEHVKKQLLTADRQQECRTEENINQHHSDSNQQQQQQQQIIEHKFKGHKKKVNRLKEDNIRLAAMVQELEDKASLQLKRYKDIQRENLKLNKEKQLIKQQFQEQGQLLQNNYFNKNNKEYLAEKSLINDQIQGLENNIQALEDQLREARRQRNQLDSKNQELNELLKQQDSQFNDQLQHEMQQLQTMNLMFKKEQKQKEKVLEEHCQLLQLIGCDDDQLSIVDSKKSELEVCQNILGLLQQKIYQLNRNRQKHCREYQKKRVPKVNSYQVTSLAQMLLYNLLLHRIPLHQVHLYLFTQDIINKAYISIEDIITQLQKQPFELENNEELVLFCRYLIEDNCESYIILDLERESDLVRVLSVIKTLLGNYEIGSEEEEQELYQSVSGIIKNSKKFMRDYMVNTLMEGRNEEAKGRLGEERVTTQELLATFEYIDATLTPQQKHYLHLSMYAHSRQLGIIHLTHLFNYFDGQSYVSHPPYTLQQHQQLHSQQLHQQQYQQSKEYIYEQQQEQENNEQQ